MRRLLGWRLVYEASGSLPRQVRGYEMVPVDAAKGHYVLDEKNGLRLDAFVVGRAIYTYFDDLRQSHPRA